MAKRSTLEEQEALLTAKLARVRAKAALKELATIPTGKKMLLAMRALAWVGRQQEINACTKVAADALEVIVQGLSKAYKVSPADLTPAAKGEVGEVEDETPPLPFEGEREVPGEARLPA